MKKRGSLGFWAKLTHPNPFFFSLAKERILGKWRMQVPQETEEDLIMSSALSIWGLLHGNRFRMFVSIFSVFFVHLIHILNCLSNF